MTIYEGVFSRDHPHRLDTRFLQIISSVKRHLGTIAKVVASFDCLRAKFNSSKHRGHWSRDPWLVEVSRDAVSVVGLVPQIVDIGNFRRDIEVVGIKRE